jgi:hypothetical protein
MLIRTKKGEECAVQKEHSTLEGIIIQVSDDIIFNDINVNDEIDLFKNEEDVHPEWLIVKRKREGNVLVCFYADPG